MKDSDTSKAKKIDPIPSIGQPDYLNKGGRSLNKNTKKYKFFTPSSSQKINKSEEGASRNNIGIVSASSKILTAPFRFIKNILSGTSAFAYGDLGKNHTHSNNSRNNTEEDSIWVQNQEFRKNLENFVSKTAEDIMIPRSDIFAVSQDYPLEQLCEIISKNNHTRTLVYRENLDDIIGFIHIKDLFKIVTQEKKYNFSSVLRKHIVCPCSMKLINLFKQMQDNRVHIAIVVDEYGGTDGLITIEDVIEEIVGRIEDEHDHDIENDSFKIIKPGVIIANARLNIEEIETVLKCRLKGEEDDFDTIGGLVIAKSGHIPSKGDIININDKISIEVIDSTPRTIKQLKVIFKL